MIRAGVLRARARALVRHASALPDEVDAVVIGGGSLGTSAAYHLQQRGIGTALLEAHQLTAGTTWHTAGMLWRLRPSYVDIELHAYTREKCISMEGDDAIGIPSWTENGGLFIACNRERLAEYERLAETGKYYGIESAVLSPADARAVHPLLNVDDVFGAIHSPSDGTIDASGVVHAYAKGARALGARVAEGVAVRAVETEPYTTAGGASARRVVAVVTADGQRIRTRAVVNACGAWANEVAEMAGARLPLRAMKHAYVVTDSLEGMHGGLPNVRDHDLSIYLKAQGDALALGGYEVNPEFWHGVGESDDFAFTLFELDWETFMQNTEGHIQRCPAVESAGIKSTVCGPESFTPDHKPLVGPEPSVRGLFHCCGFNSMGMMLGGGIGRELATWIDTGAPELDLFGFDPARFHPECVADGTWVTQATHESYAKTYSIVFPHDEPLASRGARTSALHDALRARGCVHQARHGFERPGFFSRDDGAAAAPKPYDYYGAYAEGGWRLAPDHADVAAHAEHR